MTAPWPRFGSVPSVTITDLGLRVTTVVTLRLALATTFLDALPRLFPDMSSPPLHAKSDKIYYKDKIFLGQENIDTL